MNRAEKFKPKLNLIQSFRGIAAIAVVLFHATHLVNAKLRYVYPFNPFKIGWAGVDFFFLLSGFIIFYAHRFDFNQRDKLKPFIIKRLIRIYPIYWLVTATVLSFFLIFPSLSKNGDLSLFHIIKSFLLIPDSRKPILDVAWTLCHEVFFYIIFGIAIGLKPKISLPIITTLILGTVLQLTMPSNPIFRGNFWFSFIFDPLHIEFLLGCIAAYLVINYKIHHRLSTTLIYVGSVLLLMAGTYAAFQDELIAFNTVGRLVYLCIPFTMLLTGAASLDMAGRSRVPVVFNHLGDSSYSIYLIHGPIISAVIAFAARGHLQQSFESLLTPILLTFLITLIGCILYSSIERQLLKYLRGAFLKT